METLTLPALQSALIYVAQTVVENEPRLTQLDTIIGDGDHGYGMRDGFTALQALLETTQFDDPYSLLRASGIELLRSMGGASGVIFGTLFTGGHDIVTGLTALSADDLILFLDAGAAAIMKRGRSKPGDKTMLDALVPAIAAMKTRRASTSDILQLLEAAKTGAETGVEASKQMLPRTGRSKNFREQALGYPDPGAVSVSIIFEALHKDILLYNDKETGK